VTGRYLTDLADVCRGAGVTVVEMAGWPTRARGSGGYPSGRPWVVMWHHTASAGNGANDAAYCATGDPDAPVCNLVVGRDGIVYVIAAGATNTNGKGGPWRCSHGTVGADQMNTHAVGIEFSNNGVGQAWPRIQLDAGFAVSLAVAAAYGLAPDDVCTHQVWAPTRKIDPATAAAVEGPWRPSSSTSSGTWSLPDLAAECNRRAANAVPNPEPTPDPAEDDDMALYLVLYPGSSAQFVTDSATFKTPIATPDVAWQGVTALGWRSATPGQPDPIVLEPGWAPYLDALPTIGP
jgi:N-acetylmuramoyl-L-alanine amidase